MNDQTSTRAQLLKLVDLANQNGLPDAADWVSTQIQQRRRSFMYYRHPTLGAVGVPLGHEDGEYTLLLGHMRYYSWIRTADLHNSRAEAEAGPVATFAEQTP